MYYSETCLFFIQRAFFFSILVNTLAKHFNGFIILHKCVNRGLLNPCHAFEYLGNSYSIFF